MTKAEARATNVVLAWAFNKAEYNPELLRASFELLAAGAHRSLKDGITPETVRTWSK